MTRQQLLWRVYDCVLAIAIVATAVSIGCKTEPPPVPVPGDPDPQPEEPAYPEISDELMNLYSLHNSDREKRGIEGLTLHAQAIKAAQKHANWMAANNKMSHTGKGGSSFWDRLKAEGYRGTGGGENIARGYSNPATVMNGWLNSPGHRDNIRNPQWQHVGLGVATAKNGQRYWCAVFGRGGTSALSEGDPQLVLMLPEPLDAAEAESGG